MAVKQLLMLLEQKHDVHPAVKRHLSSASFIVAASYDALIGAANTKMNGEL